MHIQAIEIDELLQVLAALAADYVAFANDQFVKPGKLLQPIASPLKPTRGTLGPTMHGRIRNH